MHGPGLKVFRPLYWVSTDANSRKRTKNQKELIALAVAICYLVGIAGVGHRLHYNHSDMNHGFFGAVSSA
jgi:hypothetical protein